MTKLKLVAEKLNGLSVGENFSKMEFIKLNWDKNDYFSQRSFDVSLCNAKKQFPAKVFKCIGKLIVRIE
jgi:hypothetical protein